MAELGFLRCGPQGAGHFGKMVHSGIECGLMAAYAEGLNILRHANMGKQQRDAETTPLRDPEVYQFDFNPPKIAVVSRHGSVIGSWFFDITAQMLRNDADLKNLAGALTAGMLFSADTSSEQEIRLLADALYRRADWQWGQDGGTTVTHGWKLESGFLKYRWEGYDEALLLYVLGLGSPTHPLPESSYAAWSSTYRWEQCYGYDYLYAGPLFTHQLSHVWIDFREIQDAFMRDKGSDYFENSRRATYVQQQYAIHNPLKFKDYGPHCWGITASESPGPDARKIDGFERPFFDYVGRGVPYGPDDGTLAPWTLVVSLPFAPEIVLPAIHHCVHQAKLTQFSSYGFKASFNPSHPGDAGNSYGWWVSLWHYELNQGPIILMIENYCSGMVWNLMRSCPYIVARLRRTGFGGGWL